MSLYDEIKIRVTQCMKEGNKEERDILRTLIGEVQSKTISSGAEITDELVEKTLVSFKENALECIKYSHADDSSELHDAVESRYEIDIYDKFLPRYESVDSIVNILSSNIEVLKSAKSDGQATGVAMGILKKSGVKIQGKDVSVAVQKIRA